MAKIQTTFTYTLPAQSCDVTPPPAPIRCGCDSIILILKDAGVTVSSKKGMIDALIVSVAISSKPLNYTDPGSGVSSLVWRYDYVLEYDSANFIDPTYRVRKCDVAHNCCHSCSQVYTDRLLTGYVQSVKGTAVNNTDPQNPVVNKSSLVVGTLGGPGVVTSMLFTNEIGETQNFPVGPSQIVATTACKGIGAGQTIEKMQINQQSLVVETARMPSFVQGGAVGTFVGVPLDITALGNYDMSEILMTIANPNPCYTLQGWIYSEAKLDVNPLQDSASIQLQISLTVNPASDNYRITDQYENGGSAATRAITLKHNEVLNLNELIPTGILPLGSATFKLKVRVSNVSGGAPGTIMSALFGSLRFMGMASQ